MRREMTDIERKVLQNRITEILAMSVGWDYARVILEFYKYEDCEDGNEMETFMSAVVEDVLSSSAWDDEGYYNDDDIRLAIGRVFIDWLDIPY